MESKVIRFSDIQRNPNHSLSPKDYIGKTEDTFDDLPEFCYSTSELNGKTILIKRGETGYYTTTYADIPAQSLNEQLGIIKEEQIAMVHGSMFGWDTPGANPLAYKALNKKKGK
jgi:hypothetical protein